MTTLELTQVLLEIAMFWGFPFTLLFILSRIK
jgi:hypothetical protein